MIISTRRVFGKQLLGTAVCGSAGIARSFANQGTTHVEPSWASISKHEVPSWYRDAKLGIFIHWGLYSVPAWAPPTGELGKVDWNKWFRNNPYAEWYLNTLRIEGSPTYKHHTETYGPNFDYYDFARTFNDNTAKWDPNSW